ncbi:hypothetical protein ACQEWB_29425 [Streptomyces sp. CA-249302]|uniref:hypothetical protein n=1 Tax=Streptomyces sp. CA-249302 TaxID=3240058 RepID=UPI003D945ACF
MTWPAALPGAALRVMRTAVGRRALQVVVVVGGLFALGFFCGEQAHAAEGVPLASSSEVVPAVPAAVGDGVRSLASGVFGPSSPTTGGKGGVHGPTAAPVEQHAATPAKPRPVGKPAEVGSTAPAAAPVVPPAPKFPAPKFPARESSARKSPAHPITEILTGSGSGSLPASGEGDDILRPVTDQVVQAVGDRVLRPVGGLVETVTDELGKVTAEIPGLPSLPSLPSLPGVPSVPSLPGVPALPGQTLPAPVPSPGGASHQLPDARDTERGAGAVVSGAVYGPGLGGDADAVRRPARGAGQRAGGAGYAPVHQAPDGDPTGALDSRTGVDNSTSRHGDAHAVALSRRAPLRLLPGGAARTDAAGLRDRHRDIPVSPA